MFSIQNDLKEGDILWLLLSNFVSSYAIRAVKENNAGLKLNEISASVQC
jgi:hypothetical protein